MARSSTLRGQSVNKQKLKTHKQKQPAAYLRGRAYKHPTPWSWTKTFRLPLGDIILASATGSHDNELNDTQERVLAKYQQTQTKRANEQLRSTAHLQRRAGAMLESHRTRIKHSRTNRVKVEDQARGSILEMVSITHMGHRYLEPCSARMRGRKGAALAITSMHW